MNDLDLLLLAGDGAFSSRQASKLGVSADETARWCRSGAVVRVRRGAFVDRETYARAGPDDRYRLRVRAVMAGPPRRTWPAITPAWPSVVSLSGRSTWLASTSLHPFVATSSERGSGSTR